VQPFRGFHTGYELREMHYQDVAALCEKFDLDLRDDIKRARPE
jgi:hypothetical protein